MSVSELLQDVRRMFAGEPDLAVFFGYDPAQIACDEELLAAVLAACLAEGGARDRLRALAREVFVQDPQALEMALGDLIVVEGAVRHEGASLALGLDDPATVPAAPWKTDFTCV